MSEQDALDRLIAAERGAEANADVGEATLARIQASLAAGAAPVVELGASVNLAESPAAFMGFAGASKALLWGLFGVLLASAAALAWTRPWETEPTRVQAPAIEAKAELPEATPNEEAVAAPLVEIPDPPPAPPVDAAPTPPVETASSKRPPAQEQVRPAPKPPEIELIREARAALAAKQWLSVLSLTRQLEKFHPQGMMVEEREALRTLALCALDRWSAGERFLQRFPGSVSTERVKAACTPAAALGPKLEP